MKESSEKMKNMRWRGRSSKVWERSKKVSTKTLLQVDSCFWKETKQKNAHKKTLGLYC